MPEMPCRLPGRQKGTSAALKFQADGKTANGKQVLSLIGLAAKTGAELAFSLEGEDEEEAAAYLQALVKEVV